MPAEYNDSGLWVACLEGGRRGTLAELAQRSAEILMAIHAPELKYWSSALMAACGQHEPALRLLARAVDEGYCAYPAVDTDPLWVSLRDDPELRRIRDQAIACHARYRALVTPPS